MEHLIFPEGLREDDSPISRLILDKSDESRRWSRRNPITREHEFRECSSEKVIVSSVIGAVEICLEKLVNFLCTPGGPVVSLSHGENLLDWLKNTYQAWKYFPDSRVLWRRELGGAQWKDLLCKAVSYTWIGKNGPLGGELVLEFKRAADKEAQMFRYMEVVLLLGGEENRSKFKRTEKHVLNSYIKKRVYLPNKNLSDGAVYGHVEAALNEICLYLAQEKIVDFDEDIKTRKRFEDFLRNHIPKRYLENREEVDRFVRELLGHAWRNYLVPQGCGGFQKYIKAVSMGLIKQENKKNNEIYKNSCADDDGESNWIDRKNALSRDSPGSWQHSAIDQDEDIKKLMPFRGKNQDEEADRRPDSVSNTLGISRSTIYSLLRAGKIQADDGYLTEDSIDYLINWKEKREKIGDVVTYLVERGEKERSARRWIQRLAKEEMAIGLITLKAFEKVKKRRKEGRE